MKFDLEIISVSCCLRSTKSFVFPLLLQKSWSFSKDFQTYFGRFFPAILVAVSVYLDFSISEADNAFSKVEDCDVIAGYIANISDQRDNAYIKPSVNNWVVGSKYINARYRIDIHRATYTNKNSSGQMPMPN
jgi:hypothetical protein